MWHVLKNFTYNNIICESEKFVPFVKMKLQTQNINHIFFTNCSLINNVHLNIILKCNKSHIYLILSSHMNIVR